MKIKESTNWNVGGTFVFSWIRESTIRKRKHTKQVIKKKEKKNQIKPKRQKNRNK
jgi:hypothetical protein